MLTWTLVFIFWLSLLALFYAYAGYPLCAFCITRIRRQTVNKEKFQPPVTILIAAYNEEECIAATLKNKLALDYPHDKLEIIVISDESQDQTDAIVQSFADKGVTLLRQSSLVSSNSEARRKIKEGAVSINGEKIFEHTAEITVKDNDIIRLGKRNFRRIVFN